MKVIKSNFQRRVINYEKTFKTVNTKIGASGLDTTRFIVNETPTPVADGAQTVFTTANAYVSGLHQIKTTDYSETTSTTFTMTTAPATGEILTVNYIKV